KAFDSASAFRRYQRGIHLAKLVSHLQKRRPPERLLPHRRWSPLVPAIKTLQEVTIAKRLQLLIQLCQFAIVEVRDRARGKHRKHHLTRRRRVGRETGPAQEDSMRALANLGNLRRHPGTA